MYSFEHLRCLPTDPGQGRAIKGGADTISKRVSWAPLPASQSHSNDSTAEVEVSSKLVDFARFACMLQRSCMSHRQPGLLPALFSPVACKHGASSHMCMKYTIILLTCMVQPPRGMLLLHTFRTWHEQGRHQVLCCAARCVAQLGLCLWM